MRYSPIPLAVLLLATTACGPGEDPLAPAPMHPRPASGEDPVVAMVDGEPIYLSRVREISEQTGRPPREVLDGMVDMTLLAHEALRRDLDEEPEVARVWNKALVRALLDDRVEAAVPDWSVGVEDVRAYYVANFENRGVLLEDAWRDIWLHLVAERRRERYDALVEQARGHTKVVVHDENVERHLGGGSGGG